MTTTANLISRSKGLTFSQNNYLIENSGLELNLIQNLPFSKMWEVKNNNEISTLSNTIADLTNNLSEVKAGFTI